MTTAQRFEDRLLDELRLVVADRPAPAATAASRPRRLRRPLIGIGVVATGAAAIAIVAASGSRTPSAYAVQPRADGAVTVTIRSLQDAAGLQQRLRAAGVPAFVDYAAGGIACVKDAKPPAGGASGSVQGIQRSGTGSGGTAPALPAGAAEGGTAFHTERGSDSGPVLSGPAPDAGAPATTKVSVTPNGATFTIDPGTLKTGQHVYITTSTGAVTSIAMSVAKTKPAIPCPPAP